jgi:hypothetical protein
MQTCPFPKPDPENAMNHLLAIILLSILTLPSTNAAMAGVGPTPEAIRIIEEFNLREAATPIA